MFGVGYGYEPLAALGLTHLVEHLALADLAYRNYDYNGVVEETRTIFYAQGSPAQLVQFAAAVTTALSSLPVERIEAEKRILQTEEMAHPMGSWANHMSLRFGASRHGMMDYPQYGLKWLGAQEVTRWAAQHFNRGNAAATMSGPPPEDLRFHLPDGARQPPLESKPLPGPWPSYRQHAVRGVGVTMIARRTAAHNCATRIMGRRAREQLRWSKGIAYSPASHQRPLDPRTSQIFLSSDALPEHADAVADVLLDMVRGMCEHGPTDGELQDDRLAFKGFRSSSSWPLANLDRYCRSELDDVPAVPEDEYADRLMSVTAEDVTAACRQAWATALVLVPQGSSSKALELQRYPNWSPTVIAGERFRRRLLLPNESPSGSVITASHEGLSLTMPGGNSVTVRFDEVAAVMWWHDGTRILIGQDGSSLRLRAAEWYGSEKILQLILERIPPERLVPVEAPITDPAAAASDCEVCEATPAIPITLRRWAGPRRPLQLKVRLCRDCGRSLMRYRTDQYLVLSWRLFTLGFTIGPMIANSLELWRLGKLAAPDRPGGVDYWRPGVSIWRRPGPYVFLLILELAAIVVFGLVKVLTSI